MFFIRKKLPKKCDFCTRFLRAEARVCSGAGHDFDRFTSSGWSRRIFYCRVCREPAHMVALGDPWSPDSLRSLKFRILELAIGFEMFYTLSGVDMSTGSEKSQRQKIGTPL